MERGKRPAPPPHPSFRYMLTSHRLSATPREYHENKHGHENKHDPHAGSEEVKDGMALSCEGPNTYGARAAVCVSGIRQGGC